jgi:hypothetical protein
VIPAQNGEGADIGEQRRCAAGLRLRFGLSSAQYRRACRGESRPGLQHDTPVVRVRAATGALDVRQWKSAIFRKLTGGVSKQHKGEENG